MQNEQLIMRLVCPDCQGRLLLRDHALHCGHCGQAFPIKENIPVFYNDKLVEGDVAKEYSYWNEKTNTPEELYENMPDAAFQKLLTLFNIPDNTTGLELGAGDGPFARRLQNKNLDIYGLDISFPLLKLTENMLPVQGNALKLPFRDNFFDWIIYGFALHHMPDPQKAIEEAARVLAYDGKIFIVDPNYYHPIRFLTRRPNMFLRKYVFTYLSPEEKWVPAFRVKKFLKAHDIAIDSLLFISPEFESSSLAGKIQEVLARVFRFPPFRMFVQSYYLVIGRKLK